MGGEGKKGSKGGGHKGRAVNRFGVPGMEKAEGNVMGKASPKASRTKGSLRTKENQRLAKEKTVSLCRVCNQLGNWGSECPNRNSANQVQQDSSNGATQQARHRPRPPSGYAGSVASSTRLSTVVAVASQCGELIFFMLALLQMDPGKKNLLLVNQSKMIGLRGQFKLRTWMRHRFNKQHLQRAPFSVRLRKSNMLTCSMNGL